jgi:hypothetical protein
VGEKSVVLPATARRPKGGGDKHQHNHGAADSERIQIHLLLLFPVDPNRILWSSNVYFKGTFMDVL